MSKRPKDFGGVPTNKRIKTEDNLEDLWGDDLDLDESVIDDCFKLATQVIEEKNITCTQLNNVSILPSYNAFKGQRSMFASTQSAPATSSLVRKNSLPEAFIQDDPQMKIKRLQEQVIAKEGEVAILRCQLKETKASVETERAKKEKEWSEQLNEKIKEIRAIQTKLEFKDLEIISLKQQKAKIINLNQSNCTQDTVSVKQNLKGVDEKPTAKEKIFSTKIKPIIEKRYPLQLKVPSSIFTIVKQEKYYIRNKKTDKQTSLFHSPLSQFMSDESQSEPLTFNIKLNLSCVSSEIGSLLYSTDTEIENSSAVTKILHISLALLHTFLSYLNQVEQFCRTEDLIRADVIYLNRKTVRVSDVTVFEARDMCDNEIGINARQSIAFLAELLPYNSNLKNCLLENRPIPLDSEYFCRYDARYLNVLLECVTLIGKLRMSSMCVGFLCAVIRLLCSLARCGGNFVDLFEHFKEIVLSRPDVNVLLELSAFLKSASGDAAFVGKLCTMQSQNMLKTNVKEGFLTYSRSSCLFHIISVLYESSLGSLKGGLLLRMVGNFLCFVHNVLMLNSPWLCCKEKKCDCLYQLTRLSIEIIISCLDDYKNIEEGVTADTPLQYTQVFSLGARLLHIINFRMYALMEKYITLYARFMEAVKRLNECKAEMKWEEEMTKLLENLLLAGEENNESSITPTAFDQVFLWNK